jgi:precorrin isomerase
MATKKELDVLSGLYESIEGKGGLKDVVKSIDEKVDEQNHSTAEIATKLAKTDEIAREANRKAKNNQKWIWGLAVVVIGGAYTILAQVL